MEKRMNNQEEKSPKETLRIEKLKAEESKLLATDQARTKAYWAREQAIEKGQKIKETRKVEDLANQAIKELAKDKSRKEAYLAQEKKIAEEQETRKFKQ
jgi:hypothetical protein